MKKSLTIGLGALFIFSTFILYAQEKQEINKVFDAKKRVRIDLASGDCDIVSGKDNEIKVDVIYSVEPEDSFEPDIQERSNEIRIKERWRGRSRGNVTWTVTV